MNYEIWTADMIKRHGIQFLEIDHDLKKLMFDCTNAFEICNNSKYKDFLNSMHTHLYLFNSYKMN
jgi:hypothetical protein